MGNSLLEQLKKTGLVDKTRANQAKHAQYKTKKQKTKKETAKDLDKARQLAEKEQAHAHGPERVPEQVLRMTGIV